MGGSRTDPDDLADTDLLSTEALSGECKLMGVPWSCVGMNLIPEMTALEKRHALPRKADSHQSGPTTEVVAGPLVGALELCMRAGSAQSDLNRHLGLSERAGWTVQIVAVHSRRSDKDRRRIDNVGLGTGGSW